MFQPAPSNPPVRSADSGASGYSSARSRQFVLTRPAFSGHTRTAAQDRESQSLKTTCHAINARAFCHGQRSMVVSVEKTRQMRRVLSKAPLPNTYARRATAHRGARGRKKGREHVFVARNRQSRHERDKDETKTCIRDAKQILAM